ncbi:MAG: hypothetical protein IKK04_03780 [Bacteroidales bacterium]|nr:hypothetical protein [Bacteroidales bacterium]
MSAKKSAQILIRPCAAKGTLAADLSLTANALLAPSAPLPLPLAQTAPLTAL